MKKVYIESNGCAVLRNETQRYAKFFRENGWKEVNSPKNADIILITTCGVIDWTEQKAIDAIKRLVKSSDSNSLILVGGCLPKINPKKIKNINKKIILFGADEEYILDRIITAKKSINSIRYTLDSQREHSLGDPEKLEFTKEELGQLKIVNFFDKKFKTNDFVEIYNYVTRGRHLWKEKDLAEVRVSYGCSANCSYCATKLAIGKTRSSPPEIILKEIKDVLKRGYKKIMLMGDEVGFYGMDIGTNIVELLNRIFKIKGDFKIGIRYMHPNILVKHYNEFQTYFSLGKIYYFCSALQSGSKKILKLMNRNPKINEFIDIISEIDKKYPRVFKHTQIIVGFPQESKSDLEETYTALEKANFDHITTTVFSPRNGTKAFKIKGRINKKELDKRYLASLKFVANNRTKQLWKKVQYELLRRLNG